MLNRNEKTSAKRLVNRFGLSDREKRNFFTSVELETLELSNVGEVKEFYQNTLELVVTKMIDEIVSLQSQNNLLSSQLLNNSAKLDEMLVRKVNVDCYDPTLSDLVQIIIDTINPTPRNETTGQSLSFSAWFSPQSAGISISAFLTAFFCYFDQRIASYISKKCNVQITSVTKVFYVCITLFNYKIIIVLQHNRISKKSISGTNLQVKFMQVEYV